ncbi:AHH domain-containing protein [Vibrio penaeicida]|uniref:AHH domain-containing protein n=1 Tax=Vibrio penaeicida TaxID=104609 RepID=UPI000CEA28C0|nr:AHH domain-containing protein [Vibrio penaeicida]
MQTGLSTAGHRSNRPANPSAAELALDRYDMLVRDFYIKYKSNKAPKAPKAQVKRMLEAEQRDLKFLKMKRTQLIAHAKVAEMEAELRDYVEGNQSKKLKELSEEEHHPTQKLARNLTAAGEPKPTINHEAHHIVPGKGRFKQAAIEGARIELHMHQIGINDPRNGVWMMNFKKNLDLNWADPKSPAHRSIHRYNYESWIGRVFLTGGMTKQMVLARLKWIKMSLKDGKYPSKITEKKDVSWNGS